MRNFFTYCISISYFLLYISCTSNSSKLINVTYINKEDNSNNSRHTRYIYVSDNDHQYIAASNIKEIKLKGEIYFYKSFTKVINFFKHGTPMNIKFAFENNYGNLILLNDNKEGVICKISDIYYSDTVAKYLVKKKEPYIENDVFYIKNYSDYNDDKINSVSLCEIKNDTFLPSKYLCYPSFNLGLNASFIKNEEYKDLLKLADTLMNKDQSDLLQNITKYFTNLFKIDFQNIHFVQYIFDRTILCNLENLLPHNLKDYNKHEKIQTELQAYSDEAISENNDYLFNNTSNYKKIDDKFVIWRHTNKDLTEKNFKKCNTTFLSQSENIYTDLQNVYETSLFKDVNISEETNSSKIKNISSLNEYTSFFYDKGGLVVILKNYEYYLHFYLKDIVGIVLFKYENAEIGFYYVSLDDNGELLHIYRCGVGSDEVTCEQISSIPYEDNLEESDIYISTVQEKDMSSVFISTRTKIWKIYANKNKVYQSKIIDSIKNEDEEYFGHINCYMIKTIYQRRLLYNLIVNGNKNEHKTTGCSYLRHFKNTPNSLLTSFIESANFIQRTYHVVKDKKFIVSSGNTILKIKVNEISDMIILLFIVICLILSIYSVFRILSINKKQLGNMKHYLFDDGTKTTCSSIVEKT